MRDLLTPNQVARAVGASEASLKRWCDKGLLPTIRTAGGHRRIPIAGVMQFLRARGMPLIRPEVLGMPAATGRGEATLERGLAGFRTAIEDGDEERARRVAIDLYLAGHSACDICDSVIGEAFHAVGDLWEHGRMEVYQERRGCEIAMRVLFELRGFLTPPEPGAPYAMGGTLHGDPYTLPTNMVELCLREAGWSAENHGTGIPVDTLCTAIGRKRPKLFWLSVSAIESVDSFLADYQALHESAEAHGAAVVVGGVALTEEMRRRMAYSAHCDKLRHLVGFARTLQEAIHGAS